MIARGRGGKIVNIGSLTSEVARATVAPYTAAKGGIKMLTRSMAAEWAIHDIQANAIGPGYIVTEMNKALAEGSKGAAASWPGSATAATTVRTGSRSSMVCSATARAARSRSRCSRATPQPDDPRLPGAENNTLQAKARLKGLTALRPSGASRRAVGSFASAHFWPNSSATYSAASPFSASMSGSTPTTSTTATAVPTI